MEDGNFLFRSIPLVVNGHERGHKQIRKQLVNFIYLKPQTFQCLVWEGSVDPLSRMMADWSLEYKVGISSSCYILSSSSVHLYSSPSDQAILLLDTP